MVPAYTLYKFKNLFFLVLAIMFVLAITSQVPGKKAILFFTGKSVASEVDETSQLKGLIGTVEKIPDPKAEAQTASGIFFFNLLNKDTEKFMIFALIITTALFAGGVPLAFVRKFLRGLG